MRIMEKLLNVKKILNKVAISPINSSILKARVSRLTKDMNPIKYASIIIWVIKIRNFYLSVYSPRIKWLMITAYSGRRVLGTRDTSPSKETYKISPKVQDLVTTCSSNVLLVQWSHFDSRNLIWPTRNSYFLKVPVPTRPGPFDPTNQLAALTQKRMHFTRLFAALRLRPAQM